MIKKPKYFQELRERIFIDLKRPYSIWNQAPGALNVDSSYSTSLSRLPFYNSPTKSVQKFTAIILAVSTVQRSSPLYRLIQTINSSEFVDQVQISQQMLSLVKYFTDYKSDFSTNLFFVFFCLNFNF